MKTTMSRVPRLASLVACLSLTLILPVGGRAASTMPPQATAVSSKPPYPSAATDATKRVPPVVTNVPPLLRPVTLKDADGNAELGLIDPFRRRSGDDGDGGIAAAPGEDGLMRTTMGEISSEFRILAITIPEDTNTPRVALIQFYNADEPILVHEGDLVRVDRLGGGRRQNGRVERPRSTAGGGRGKAATARNGRAASTRQPSAVSSKPPYRDSDLEEQLSKFVFYVNVKRIEQTYIEVYHNKKRPDETIRLNW